MWVFFYVSGPKVRQLAVQVNPRLPAETLEKRLWEAGAESELAERPGLLLRAFGADLDTRGKAPREASGSTEKKIKIAEEHTVSLVCDHLSKSRKVSLISSKSVPPPSGRVSRLVRFQGRFKPRVRGKDTIARLASYRTQKWLSWAGTCGDVMIELTTRKASFVGETPIIQCLGTEDGALDLDGFGTCDGYVRDGRLEVVPLILGVDFEA